MSKNNAEWFDNGVVLSTKIGDETHHLFANGTLHLTAPDGTEFKSDNSASCFFEQYGIENDIQVDNVIGGDKKGWECGMNRWFDHIVYDKDGEEIHCEVTEYTEFYKKVWLNKEIVNEFR